MSIFYHQEPNPWLIASSLLFLLPALEARRQHVAATATTLLSLSIVSALYHLTKNPVLYYLDQLAVLAIVSRSIVDGLKGGGASLQICVAVNAGSFVLYYVGLATHGLIWSPNFWVATGSHAFMHIGVAGGYQLLLENYHRPK
jgi:hypothetical protein